VKILQKNRPDKKRSKSKSLKELLLSGPVMSSSQFSDFKKNRKKIDAWRVK
jgi:hypothetical protein